VVVTGPHTPFGGASPLPLPREFEPSGVREGPGGHAVGWASTFASTSRAAAVAPA